MIILILILSVIDINNCSYEELKTLPLEEYSIERILNYKYEYGYFSSVYDLLKVLTPEEFKNIKDMVAILPRKDVRNIPYYLLSIQSRLASEERPSEVLMNEWEILAFRPMNINKVSFDELMKIEGVNFLDAINAARYVRGWRGIRYISDLRSAPYLTSYAYRKIRDYATTTTPQKYPIVSGYTKFSTSNWSYPENEDRIKTNTSYIDAILENTRNDNLPAYKRLKYAGWSDEEISYLRNRLTEEKEEILKLKTINLRRDLYIKTNLVIQKNIETGILFNEENTGNYFNKWFIGVKDIGFLKNFYIGNYNVTLGEGLIFENTDDILSRFYDKTEGVFGDITQTKQYKTNGFAFKLKPNRFKIIGFWSKDKKDGILNRDSTLNMYFSNPYDIAVFRDVFTEEVYGGSFGVNLSKFFIFPFGTTIAINALNVKLDKAIKLSSEDLEYKFDADEITDDVYTRRIEGNIKKFAGLSFMTAIRNFGIKGEYSAQISDDNKYISSAYILNLRYQLENFYLHTLLRHYDISYDNPYARPFMEQKRYDDTPFEKPYRLLDPLYSEIVNDPVPKPEEGIYVETRYEFNRYFILTKAYVDLWRNLAVGLPNFRAQYEFELRPIYPLRIRLAHKYQEKYRSRVTVPTKSKTNEFTFRIYALLLDRDYLDARIRIGFVEFPSTEKYKENVSIDGGYMSIGYEHNITKNLSIYGGYAIWTTNGMSQWIFEDTGIDFLYGDGDKFFVSINDRISENLFLRFKIRKKTEVNYFTGLEISGGDYHYEEDVPTYIKSFKESKTNYTLQMQIVWWW